MRRQSVMIGFLAFFAVATVGSVCADEKEVGKKSRIKKSVEEIKRISDPVKKAVTKTAETATQEIRKAAKEAHTLGGKFLQGAINIMTAASPGKTRVYLPAPSSDPNSGLTVGVLPVFLFVDDREIVRHILAPSVTYNRIFKVNTTMRYYWYPRPNAQFFTIGSYALETNRRFTLRYEDPQFYLDWFYFKFDYTLRRDGSLRYFGLGPKSDAEKQCNYTLRDQHLQIYTGVNFLEKFRFTVAHRFRFANAVDGPIDSLPDISLFMPRPTGVEEEKTIMAQRFSLEFDCRDLAMAPVRGHYVQIFAEAGGRLGGDAKFERIGTDLRGYYPIRDDKYVTAWRFLYEKVKDGTEVPFYERSLLGGKDSLRGYGDARFVDQGKLSYSIEERIRFYTLSAFNVNVDFEVAPFYEAGTVFPQASKIRGNDLHHVGGVGFRSVVRPNVVGVVELGYGDEGSAIFVGIDYPF